MPMLTERELRTLLWLFETCLSLVLLYPQTYMLGSFGSHKAVGPPLLALFFQYSAILIVSPNASPAQREEPDFALSACTDPFTSSISLVPESHLYIP